MSPETATYSKAASADVVFTVSSNTGITITGVKIGAVAVNADNYTVNGGIATLKGTYLATLANGEKTFTLVVDKGNNLSVIVTIGD